MFWALIGMVVFGFGEVIGGFMHGLTIDYMGSKKTVLVSTSITILTFSCALISIYRLKLDYVSYTMCFLWGYQDGVTNTNLN